MNTDNVFEFYDAPREYLVLNAGDTELPLQYDAETFMVPAGDKVKLPDGKSLFCSGKNSAGEYIPGSLVLRDIYGLRGSPDDVDGSMSLRGQKWSAEACIKHCLQIPILNTPKNAKPMGPLAERGLTILPMNPGADLVARAREEARAKYEAFMLKWAEDTIFAYKDSAEKHKQHNLTAKAPKEDYFVALKYKRKADEKFRQREAELGGDLLGPVPAQDDSEEEFLVYARIQAEKAATVAAAEQKVDRDDLAEILMKDPEFKAALKKSYLVRKKRGPNKAKLEASE